MHISVAPPCIFCSYFCSKLKKIQLPGPPAALHRRLLFVPEMSSSQTMPSCTKEHNPTVYVKASKRYKQIMADYKERDEPMAIKAWKVLPSPKNRLGAPLNIPYIHVDLAGNILNTNGWDPKRPKPGVAVRRTNPDKVKKLREHAKTMHATAPRFVPPVAVDSPEAIYE